jgi:catechol 2,3-dioxygenase-like lactoylglutathione lyase family enzyme
MKMAAPLEVGICCADLAALKTFYVEQLSFREIGVIDVPAEKAAPTGLSSGGYRVVRLQSPWGERLKLLQPATPPSPRALDAEILARVGTSYLTFIVDDLQGVLDGLLRRRAALVSGPRKIEVRPGVLLVFARDPEGNLLEFVQYADLAAYRPELTRGPAA